jgi:hypothetical protein
VHALQPIATVAKIKVVFLDLVVLSCKIKENNRYDVSIAICDCDGRLWSIQCGACLIIQLHLPDSLRCGGGAYCYILAMCRIQYQNGSVQIDADRVCHLNQSRYHRPKSQWLHSNQRGSCASTNLTITSRNSKWLHSIQFNVVSINWHQDLIFECLESSHCGSCAAINCHLLKIVMLWSIQ